MIKRSRKKRAREKEEILRAGGIDPLKLKSKMTEHANKKVKTDKGKQRSSGFPVFLRIVV